MTAENWGGGWIYGPDYLSHRGVAVHPRRGRERQQPRMTQLIAATITGPASREAQALKTYAQYAKRQLPVLFTPTQIGTYESDAGTLVAKALVAMLPDASRSP